MGAESQKLYDREIAVYQHLHPMLRQLRTEAGLTNDDIPLNVPEVYYTNLDSTSGQDNCTVLVMEELKSQGFKMTDKRDGAPMEAAKLTLMSLANYHALTIMLLKKHKNQDGSYSLPSCLDYIYEKFMFAEKGPEMISNAMPMYLQLIRKQGHAEVE